MHPKSKILMAATVAALLGACGQDTGDETTPALGETAGEPADETGDDTARERFGPVTPDEGLSPTGTPTATTAGPADAGAAAVPLVTAAVAQLRPTEGNSVQGSVRFELASAGLESAETDATGIDITGTVEGLAQGQHGFHVHEFGDCSAPDASSAGDHFNPEGHPHGGPDDAARHVGDLGNLEAGSEESAPIALRDNRIRLAGSHSIIGRGLVVHAAPDDLESQPGGEAGARIACGVIGVAGTSAAEPVPAPGEPVPPAGGPDEPAEGG